MASTTRPRRYFALHFLILRFLGLGWWHHPDERDTRNFQGWYLYYSIVTQLVWVVGFVGLETIDPFIGEKDIDRFMFSLSFVITHDLTLIKLYIFYFKNDQIQDIVHTLEIDMYDYYQNNAKNRSTIRLAKIMTGSFLFFGWITIGNTNVYGTVQDIRWKAEVMKLNDTALVPLRTLPQPIYIPWKYQTDQSYISTFVLETVGLLWTGHIVMTIDTFIASVILHMSAQFSNLCEALTTAYDRTMLRLYEGVRQDNNSNITTETDDVYESCCRDDMEKLVKARYAEEDIELALTKTLKTCFRQHQLVIGILGLGWWHHPDEGLTWNFKGWYLYYAVATQLIWVLGFVGLETVDPFIGDKDKNRFMFSLSFVITHDLTGIKLIIFYFRNRLIQDIIRTLEIDLLVYYHNATKVRSMARIAKIMTSSFGFFGWITILNNLVYGTIQDSRWKAEVATLNETAMMPARTLPLPIYFPWKYQTDKSFYLTFALEAGGLLWTGHIVMTIDTFIGSVILHMSTHFDILREAIVTAYDRTILALYRKDIGIMETPEASIVYESNGQDDIEEFVKARYPAEEIESALAKTLKSCFRQHQVLVGCVEKFKTTYSYGFMTQLLSSMAAICVVMVQVSQDASSFKSMRLVTSLAFFAAMIIQLALQCFTGNELTLQASAVGDAVMHSKWEKMSPRLQRQLLMMMLRSQRPLRLSAAGFAYMNIDCFLAIMKAAYSYYAVLSQKNV